MNNRYTSFDDINERAELLMIQGRFILCSLPLWIIELKVEPHVGSSSFTFITPLYLNCVLILLGIVPRYKCLSDLSTLSFML